jgi:hypothetical protein
MKPGKLPKLTPRLLLRLTPRVKNPTNGVNQKGDGILDFSRIPSPLFIYIF